MENIYNKFIIHSLFFKSVLSFYKVEYNSETVDNVHALDTICFTNTKIAFEMMAQLELRNLDLDFLGISD